MTKEGTRGQLYGSHEYKEIPRLHCAPVEMTKEETREQLYGSQEYKRFLHCTALPPTVLRSGRNDKRRMRE